MLPKTEPAPLMEIGDQQPDLLRDMPSTECLSALDALGEYQCTLIYALFALYYSLFLVSERVKCFQRSKKRANCVGTLEGIFITMIRMQ